MFESESSLWQLPFVAVAALSMGLALWGQAVASAIATSLLAAMALAAPRRIARSTKANPTDVARPATRLHAALIRSLPIWAKQVDTTRLACEEAVLALTELFRSTVRRCSAAAEASRRAVEEIGGGRGALAAIERSDADLRGVTLTLKSLQSSKAAMLAEVKRYAEDLKAMAEEVQHIAMQVRLLSFNAAVEAARGR